MGTKSVKPKTEIEFHSKVTPEPETDCELSSAEDLAAANEAARIRGLLPAEVSIISAEVNARHKTAIIGITVNARREEAIKIADALHPAIFDDVLETFSDVTGDGSGWERVFTGHDPRTLPAPPAPNNGKPKVKNKRR